MIIGITGTDGAGKGTVVDYLVNECGFQHHSSRAVIMEEIAKQGLEPTRNQMRLTANELRAKEGDDFLVRRALQSIQRDEMKRAVIESIRALAEAETLKAAGGVLLAIDADPQLRFQRVQARRSETDKVTFDEFLAHEELERNDPDPHGMQKAAVMDMADQTFLNNTTMEELHEAVRMWLKAQ